MPKMSIGAFWTLASAQTMSTLCTQRGLRRVSNPRAFAASRNAELNDAFVSVYLSRIDGTAIQLQPLFLEPTKPSFCIFSVAFAESGNEIIGGGSDGCMYIYDLVENRRTCQIPVASDSMDVNAVGFIDENSNIIYSAADNGVIRVSRSPASPRSSRE